MIPEKLRIVDADTLLSTPLEKTLFIVEGLIPQGVTLLGGAGKIGKSWLMLRLGLLAAQGLPLWDLRTTRCDVLYLSLEDTLSRLQSRLYRLTDEAPPGLRYATACGKLGSGLEEQITQALRDYPETKLVIIDTLQRARDSRSAAGKAGLYSADYDDISALKQIADGQGIAIVLVHHLRKLPDGNDPFNQLSGSTGITGAADTSMVLLRQRGSDTATLLAALDERETPSNVITKYLGAMQTKCCVPRVSPIGSGAQAKTACCTSPMTVMTAMTANPGYSENAVTAVMKQIQEWLGHSDISTTSNIYAHLDYSSKVLSASTMEGALKLPELNLTKNWD